MAINWGTTDHSSTTAQTPVILPLRADERPASSAAGRGEAMRFTFPELAEPAVERPKTATTLVQWPIFRRPETARACAETAESIMRRVQPGGSSVVALTSPGDGDGKTTLMLALAPELAKLAGETLVVDADFYEPDLTSRLMLSNRNTSLGPTSLVYPTDCAELSVLPVAANMCKWGREWFEDVRERWRMILLDMPSLQRAEPAQLVRHCDGVYLVVRLGHTARRAVADSCRAIQARGGRMLGNIVVG